MIDQIRPAEVADWFAQNPSATPVVLDVREPWELQTASVQPKGFTGLGKIVDRARVDNVRNRHAGAGGLHAVTSCRRRRSVVRAARARARSAGYQR